MIGYKTLGKTFIYKMLWVIIIIAFVYTLYVFVSTFVLMSFKVPTSSMEPTIMSGQHVLVNRMSYGRRYLSISNGEKILHGQISRGFAMSKPKHNDIIVFNQTCYMGWDTIALDKMKYFVKRCVALPGDSFYIKDCRYCVVGLDENLGLVDMQEVNETITRNEQYVKKMGIPYETLPYWDSLGWNVRDFGPLYIPQKGDTIHFNEKNMRIYRKYIEWELGHKILWNEKGFFGPDNTSMTYHVMRQNYYFMCGDNTLNSLDSRFWGLVPEEFIVGKVIITY